MKTLVPSSVGAEVRPAGAPKSRIWWWVIVAFAVQLCAWTAWFTIAARAPVQEVPLASATGQR